ncbi:hypothetical protein [Microbulbifer hydrolyticus]|uniref:Uncharacterized protein n=1 Tax=Microbulbifer hydrolyticus TaxID=48074 RepID=A0A6P1T7D2_9GAMM|nr:hypothetical protein [Microbulbifer hydrolyticus]MBB5213124.1 hypothetical protein [Microbulbifer hydrolyticus]QHQ38668.1 hypothetical protein GTQ55_06475 [Microbulbifer hydrolyticus]
MNKITGILLALLSFSLKAEVTVEQLEEFDGWVYGHAMRTEEEIFNFGELVDVSSKETITNGGVAELKEYTFSKGHISAIVFSPDNVSVLGIRSSAPGYELKNGISVGDPSSILQSMPISSEGGEYCGINNCVNFDLNGEVIASFTIEFYVD